MTVTRIATFGKCIVAGEHAVLRGIRRWFSHFVENGLSWNTTRMIRH